MSCFAPGRAWVPGTETGIVRPQVRRATRYPAGVLERRSAAAETGLIALRVIAPER
jgi:hypothetical protein